MTTTTHAPDLTHAHDNGVIVECDSNHSSASVTAIQTPIVTQSKPEDLKAEKPRLADFAAVRKFNGPGEKSETKPLPHMVASVFVAASRKEPSSRLTIPKPTAQSIVGKVCEAGGFTSGSKSKTTPKTASNSSVSTVTVGGGNMASARTNFTPGPWKTFGLEVGKSKRHLICTLYQQSGNSVSLGVEVTKANARLIAAAPDLLEVARMAASSIKVEEMALITAARAAIAKAQGGQGIADSNLGRSVSLAFVLSMPNVGSWNGAWSGQGTCYAIVRRFSSIKAVARARLLVGHHSYNFGDGWRASIEVKEIQTAEARRLRKVSMGFCGYDWMVDSLCADGAIYGPMQPQPATHENPLPAKA